MRVFMSHSLKDGPVVDKISQALRKNGHTISNEGVGRLPGDNLIRAISAAISESDVMLVALSEAAVRSDWVRTEACTILREAEGMQKRLIPLRLDQSPVPSYLANFVWINFASRKAGVLGPHHPNGARRRPWTLEDVKEISARIQATREAWKPKEN
jgi:hypothetical protein